MIAGRYNYGRIRLTTVGRSCRLRVRLTQCGHSCSYCGFGAAASLTQSGQKNAMIAGKPADDCGRLHVGGNSMPHRIPTMFRNLTRYESRGVVLAHESWFSDFWGFGTIGLTVLHPSVGYLSDDKGLLVLEFFAML